MDDDLTFAAISLHLSYRTTMLDWAIVSAINDCFRGRGVPRPALSAYQTVHLL
jgi:hypothetical protein